MLFVEKQNHRVHGQILYFGLILLLGLAFVAPSEGIAKPKYVLKLATLAPPGSSWLNAFQAANREIKKVTGGEVAFKIYAGGVMGDEPAMVRKMRTGQLDGAALTSVGLGEVEEQLLMLQLPLLFKNSKELDHVRDKMSGTFEKLLGDKGFVILGWGDVGFNYLFSDGPIRTPADAKAAKVWVWDADPISQEVMRVAGINAVPLGVPDVLPSLSTGVIDAFINSPYGAVALQWHTRAKHITDLKLAVTIGGSVLTMKAWNSLPPEYQEIVKTVSAKHHRALLKRIRKDNKSAVSTLKKAGISVVSLPKGVIAEWKKVAHTVRENLAKKMFKKETIEAMLRHLKEYRAGK